MSTEIPKPCLITGCKNSASCPLYTLAEKMEKVNNMYLDESLANSMLSNAKARSAPEAYCVDAGALWKKVDENIKNGRFAVREDMGQTLIPKEKE